MTTAIQHVNITSQKGGNNWGKNELVDYIHKIKYILIYLKPSNFFS